MSAIIIIVICSSRNSAWKATHWLCHNPPLWPNPKPFWKPSLTKAGLVSCTVWVEPVLDSMLCRNHPPPSLGCQSLKSGDLLDLLSELHTQYTSCRRTHSSSGLTSFLTPSRPGGGRFAQTTELLLPAWKGRQASLYFGVTTLRTMAVLQGALLAPQ